MHVTGTKADARLLGLACSGRGETLAPATVASTEKAAATAGGHDATNEPGPGLRTEVNSRYIASTAAATAAAITTATAPIASTAKAAAAAVSSGRDATNAGGDYAP